MFEVGTWKEHGIKDRSRDRSLGEFFLIDVYCCCWMWTPGISQTTSWKLFRSTHCSPPKKKKNHCWKRQLPSQIQRQSRWSPAKINNIIFCHSAESSPASSQSHLQSTLPSPPPPPTHPIRLSSPPRGHLLHIPRAGRRIIRPSSGAASPAPH